MSTKLKDVVNEMAAYIYNPDSLIDIGLDRLRDFSDPDKDIMLMDPSDPVVYTVENSALYAHAAITHDWHCMTKTYPRLAMTRADLYAHMSDKDHVDLFDQPASTVAMLLINKEEIIKQAVPPQSSGMRRIIIPRDSKFMVDGYAFTMQYPIEIRVLPSGGLRIVQLNDSESPVRVMDTNNIDWMEVNKEVEGRAYTCIAINIPVMQYDIRSTISPLVTGMSFAQKFAYEDKFYFARVWMRTGKEWVELKTTHNQLAINVTDPTAYLQVNDGTIQVKIPDIYIRQKLVAGEIRVDVYTTKGVMSADYGGYNSDAFTMAIRDIGGEIDPYLITPFEKLTFRQVYFQQRISGGRTALTFEQLKNRVIDNAVGPRKIPISESQLEATLSDMGYTVDRSIDFVTDLQFHVSKELLPSTVKDLTTPCGSTNGIIRTTFTDLVKQPSVYDNGRRITLGPKTLYEDQFGTYAVHEKTVDDLHLLPAVQRADYINGRRLFFSPFYYVLDSNSNVFEVRPYDLDSPAITSKEFIETNISLELDIGVGECRLSKEDDGYLLRIVTRSGDAVKQLDNDQVEVQLCFRARNSEGWSRLDGKLVGYYGDDKPERVYDFPIKSTMDIDKNHDLIVRNFTINGTQVTDQALRLDAEFHIVFGVNGYTTPNYKPGNIESILYPKTNATKGVTHEVIHVHLGDHLKALWANCRSDTGGAEYLLHDTDVPARYASRVYKRENGVFVTEVGEDGQKRLVIEHEAGDIQYEPDGVTPVIQFKAGTPVYSNGQPIVLNERTILRRLELFLLDGRYAVCDQPDVMDYAKQVKEDLKKSVLFDLEFVNKAKHSQTDFFIYPRNNMGKVWVRYADNTQNQIPAELAFMFEVYVSETVRTDFVLTSKITDTIRSTVNKLLKDSTVSVSKTLDTIRKSISDSIVDIEMEAWGDEQDQKVYTMINPKDQLTMSKVAYVTPDGFVSLRDDVRISWGRLDEDLKK
ncbi:MAG: hypothetical protein ACRDDY_13825 [Clostridium sp.]|uniref:hypothetical protein n=1 Tax=Clostridium sp. TaxID=1506 RepID=UPI003EE6F6D4